MSKNTNKSVTTSRATSSTSSSKKGRTSLPKSYLVSNGNMTRRTLAASLDSAIATLGGDEVYDLDDKRLSDLQEAELLIEQVIEGAITIPRLTASHKAKIFYYLSVYNPLISRIIDLHTKLPLSTMRLQKPVHDIDIVQDYVYDYFQKIMNSDTFKEALEEIVRNYWTFGQGLGRIEDDYAYTKDTNIDESLETLVIKESTQDAKDTSKKINEAYNIDPTKVKWSDKKKVLEEYLLNINKDYKGLVRLKSIHALDIITTLSNEDIDSYIYQIPSSTGAAKWLQANSNKSLPVNKNHPLVKLGYSQGLVNLAIESMDGTVYIDSDPYGSAGVYISTLRTNRPLIDSCLESAIYNLAAIKHNNELVGLSSKIDRLVSAPGASQDQLDILNDSLAAMAEEAQGSALAVNFELQVEELSLDVKELVDLDSTIDRTNKEILSTTGMPEELAMDGGSYGSGFLKVELLSHEYVEFRHKIKSFIENSIFKPISIKKGFVTVDDWGNTIPLVPLVRFNKMSLARSSEDFAQMIDLVSQNKLPAEILYDALGLEMEDIIQKLSREKGSILDDSVQDVINNAISDMGDVFEDIPEIKAKLLESFNMPIPEELKQQIDQRKKDSKDKVSEENPDTSKA